MRKENISWNKMPRNERSSKIIQCSTCMFMWEVQFTWRKSHLFIWKHLNVGSECNYISEYNMKSKSSQLSYRISCDIWKVWNEKIFVQKMTEVFYKIESSSIFEIMSMCERVATYSYFFHLQCKCENQNSWWIWNYF